MRVKYKLDRESSPVYIIDDNDVQFLLQEVNRSKPHIFFWTNQQQTTFENIEKKQVCGEEGVIPTCDSIETYIFSSVVLMRNDNTNPREPYTTQHNIGQKRDCND